MVRKADVAREARRPTPDVIVIDRIEAKRNPTNVFPPHNDIRQNTPAAILTYAGWSEVKTREYPNSRPMVVVQ